MFNNDYDILTIDELMDYLNVGRNTAYELLRKGEIKAFKIGKIWKVSRKAIDEYISNSSK